MPTTTNFAIPYPSASDTVDVPRDIQAVADKLETTLAPTLSQYSHRNAIINGSFDVWQRATSLTFTPTAGTVRYDTADRWWTVQLATASSLTVARAAADTGGAVSGCTYGIQFGRTSGATGTGAVYFGQTLETLDTRRFAGKTVVLSFYAKRGANAPSSLDVQLWGGQGTDQSTGSLFGAGWTSGASVYSTSQAITTTMTRYSFSFTVASTVTQLAFWLKYTPTGTAGANEWYQIEGVQLEERALTPFEHRPVQVEEALCHRYYYVTSEGSSVHIGLGHYYTSTFVTVEVDFPIAMRTNAPTLEAASGTNYYINYSNNNNGDTLNGWILNVRTRTKALIYNSTEVSGTAGYASDCRGNHASAKIAFSAEL